MSRSCHIQWSSAVVEKASERVTGVDVLPWSNNTEVELRTRVPVTHAYSQVCDVAKLVESVLKNSTGLLDAVQKTLEGK